MSTQEATPSTAEASSSTTEVTPTIVEVAPSSSENKRKEMETPAENNKDNKKRRQNKKFGKGCTRIVDENWGKRNPNKVKNDDEDKLMKRRVAMIIGYLGTNYNGSQTS